MISAVRIAFNDAIIKHVKNVDCRNYLLHHERKDKVIENLCREIQKCEKRVTFDASKYDMLIEDVAKTFGLTALRHAEEQVLSCAEKSRRIDDANKVEHAKEMFENLEADDQKVVSYPGKAISD